MTKTAQAPNASPKRRRHGNGRNIIDWQEAEIDDRRLEVSGLGCNLWDDCSTCTWGSEVCDQAGGCDPEPCDDFLEDCDSDHPDNSEEDNAMNCSRLVIHCVRCGEKALEGWNYCRKCGAAIPPAVEAGPQPAIRQPAPPSPAERQPHVAPDSSIYDDDIPF